MFLNRLDDQTRHRAATGGSGPFITISARLGIARSLRSRLKWRFRSTFPAFRKNRLLSMRHTRKPIVFHVATSRERSDRVVAAQWTRSLRSRLVCYRQGCLMPLMTRQTRPRLRARLISKFSHARSKWLLEEGARQTNSSPGRRTKLRPCESARPDSPWRARTRPESSRSGSSRSPW